MRPDFDAELRELLDGALGEVLRKARKNARTGLDEDHLGLARIGEAEVMGEDVARELRDRAAQLDPGRAAADHGEGEQLPPLLRVVDLLGALEGEEDAPPDLERVLDGLEPGRPGLPLIVPEEAVPRADREDEPVVALDEVVAVARVGDVDPLVREVDARDLAEHDAHVLLLGEDAPDGVGDLARSEAGNRDLVQERLEQVVVEPIDEEDVDVDAVERLRGLEPAEAASDNHHPALPSVHGDIKEMGPYSGMSRRTRSRSVEARRDEAPR